MKKILLAVLVTLVLMAGISCGGDTAKDQTAGTIVKKEMVQDNYYNFYLEYEIEGYEGTFTATIMIKDRKVYYSYQVGDTYMCERPSR